MRIRSLPVFALASLLAAGLAGCNNENPDGTPNALGKAEQKVKDIEKKVEAGAEKAGTVIKEKSIEAAHEAGKGLEKAGKGLQEVGKDKKPE